MFFKKPKREEGKKIGAGVLPRKRRKTEEKIKNGTLAPYPSPHQRSRVEALSTGAEGGIRRKKRRGGETGMLEGEAGPGLCAQKRIGIQKTGWKRRP